MSQQSSKGGFYVPSEIADELTRLHDDGAFLTWEYQVAWKNPWKPYIRIVNIQKHYPDGRVEAYGKSESAAGGENSAEPE